MRKPMIAGNWKMNKNVEQARALVVELLPKMQQIKAVEQVICPPATAIMAINSLLNGTGIGLGAQNLHWEASGAYTGEISASMIKELCEYVIIGHSERRAYFAETDETVNKKVKAALNAGLIPIVCVGETLVENEAGQTAEVVGRQILEGLKDIDLSVAEKIVIAYEPVWAIGTGKAATGVGANTVIAENIRVPLAKLFGKAVSESVRVLYGGSVNAANAAKFFSQPEIDGALVGGASLKAEDFLAIIEAAAQ
ncbi:MAG: triose-phosphate isomerase [Anaerolineaceae bacterium]|nr:triose-phosphate isomerase [Anaerolineaceae bacterium]